MTSTAKVVSLGHRPGSPEAVRLINECRAMGNRFLSEAIQELFQKNDDTLFGFAEKGAEASGGFFEAMRALRLRKEEIIRGFLERVGKNFNRLLGAEADGASPGGTRGPLTLSLLGDAELEESLALQSMAEKTEAGCAEELMPLRNRLGSLMGGAPLEAAVDPLGAARLSEAYREALSVLNADIEVRLVLYKVFDKVLLSQIEDLYSDLNALLAKNGVMPEFKLRPKPERGRAARRQENKREEGSGGGESAEAAELLPLLRELLTQQRGGGAGGGAGGDEGGAPLSPAVVMSALTALQRQIRAIQSDGSAPVSPETVRAALAGPGGGAISRQEGDVIDLISMLFESILDDRAVPDSVRVLLARLQIPMLKVALVDRTFFSKPRHPARRLLNLLAKAGIGLDDSVGSETNPRLAEIERIVTTVLENLTDDLALFETLAGEFERFLEQQGELEAQVERRNTVAVRTREAKEKIRLAVHHKLEEFFLVQPVPAPVAELLRGSWTDVLVESRLIKDQTIWAARTQLIRDLINSVTPRASREERLAVPPVIARLLPVLRGGLSAIGYSTEQIDTVVAMLEPYHMAVIHGRPLEGGEATEARRADAAHAALARPDHAEAPAVPAAEAPADDEMFAEEIVLSGSGVVSHDVPLSTVVPPQDEYLQLARSHEVGTWFEFINSEGRKRRAKLTWKSNLLDECIFLDWRMRMVADLNMAQFAQRLSDGTVRELRDTPLFERAMDALLGRLRKKPA